MPPEEKLLAGEELFDYACAITLAGIRDQVPGAQRGGMLEDSRREIGFARTNGAAAMTAGESITLRVAEAPGGLRDSVPAFGSFASNYYGIPRSTRDADFVLQAEQRRRARICETVGRRPHPRRAINVRDEYRHISPGAPPQEEGVQSGVVPTVPRCSRSVRAFRGGAPCNSTTGRSGFLRPRTLWSQSSAGLAGRTRTTCAMSWPCSGTNWTGRRSNSGAGGTGP